MRLPRGAKPLPHAWRREHVEERAPCAEHTRARKVHVAGWVRGGLAAAPQSYIGHQAQEIPREAGYAKIAPTLSVSGVSSEPGQDATPCVQYCAKEVAGNAEAELEVRERGQLLPLEQGTVCCKHGKDEMED